MAKRHAAEAFSAKRRHPAIVPDDLLRQEPVALRKTASFGIFFQFSNDKQIADYP
jgi:hypothetical protein